jgi:predicted transposase YdaD
MGVLRESPWYQEILREGEARGKLIILRNYSKFFN